MRVALLLLTVSACGRIAFEPTGDASGSDAATTTCRQWSAFGAPVLQPALSGPYDDWNASLSFDETEAFVSWWDGADTFSIGRATRSNRTQPFSPISALGVVGDNQWARDPVLSRDGQTLYLTLQDLTLGENAIGTARRSGGGFAQAQAIQGLRSSAYNHDAHISVDELRLYYTTDERPPQGNGLILVMASRASTADDFVLPYEIVPGLETTNDEESPALSEDELEIFFSSNRAPNVGRLDVWHATRTDRSAPFGNVEHLAQLSSPLDDIGMWLSPDGTRLYFNYNADTTGGQNAEVWLATRTCLSP